MDEMFAAAHAADQCLREVAATEQEVGLRCELLLVQRANVAFGDALAELGLQYLDPAGHPVPVHAGFEHLDVVGQPNVARVGADVLHVGQQIRPVPLEEVAAPRRLGSRNSVSLDPKW